MMELRISMTFTPQYFITRLFPAMCGDKKGPRESFISLQHLSSLISLPSVEGEIFTFDAL
jgi:hypothetical protein